MAYLIDTDVAISHLRSSDVLIQILRQLPDPRRAVSIITVAELYDGAFSTVAPDARIAEIQHFLGSSMTLPVTEPITMVFGELRAYLRRRGQLIEDFDLMIAATALHHDLTVITFNRRHFERIPDLRLYPAR